VDREVLPIGPGLCGLPGMRNRGNYENSSSRHIGKQRLKRFHSTFSQDDARTRLAMAKQAAPRSSGRNNFHRTSAT
jgi:hypothetical protein